MFLRIHFRFGGILCIFFLVCIGLCRIHLSFGSFSGRYFFLVICGKLVQLAVRCDQRIKGIRIFFLRGINLFLLFCKCGGICVHFCFCQTLFRIFQRIILGIQIFFRIVCNGLLCLYSGICFFRILFRLCIFGIFICGIGSGIIQVFCGFCIFLCSIRVFFCIFYIGFCLINLVLCIRLVLLSRRFIFLCFIQLFLLFGILCFGIFQIFICFIQIILFLIHTFLCFIGRGLVCFLLCILLCLFLLF